MDQEKKNIFYRPNIAPEQSYESVSAFPVIVPVQEEEIEKSAADDFIQITNEFAGLYNSFKKIPKELQFILYDSNYPILEYLVNYTTERIETKIKEDASKDEDVTYEEDSQNIEVSLSEASNPEDMEPEIEGEDNEDVIKQSNFKTALEQITNEHERDLTLLKKDYLSSMYQVITRYFIDITECANAISSLDETYLLQPIDGNVVNMNDAKHQYIKDEIIRSQIERMSKINLFSKTHSQENTLVYLRGFIVADALRKRYCSNTIPETSATNGLAEKEALAISRNKQEQKYEKALLNYYKYLNSLAHTTGDILNMTVNEARLKAFLVKDGIDIFKTKDNQATDSTGNTNTKLTAKSKKDSFSLFDGVNLAENININTDSFTNVANEYINKSIDKAINLSSSKKET